ncbi:hypothetical protein C823_002326 [Eubacterium plexicaudatum ASF492]|uniref:Uncharacterized protein n=1 Tax=Eubacterium plexicaudatum ASF492 TaxID=1235802 RepID=N2BCQ6_9FIRM|nr:hypothetical protein C823_002326 [Eubacterium plexicaudatum ASF492]
MRTLQKAQNLYDDIRLKLKDGYRIEFYDEIRLACYAIVVETIDNLYHREPDKKQSNATLETIQRIILHYLQGALLSNNMIETLQKYSANEIDISADEIDAEYPLFIHASDKSNFYKSDDEIKQLLPNLADKIRQETTIVKIMRYADEYFIWSEHLQLDTDQFKEEYNLKLINLIYDQVMSGTIEYLTFGVEAFHIQSQTNKRIVKKVTVAVKNKMINEYIRYLSENTRGEQAYRYSYTLREFVNNTFFRDAISDNVDALYNEKSFPVHSITEQQYRTSYNIIFVLYHENQNRVLDYCNELKTR